MRSYMISIASPFSKSFVFKMFIFYPYKNAKWAFSNASDVKKKALSKTTVFLTDFGGRKA